MPDKPATVAAYAAGASLAAITLFYVFGPNFTIDGEESNTSGRKKTIVGLFNPSNDCFINSVLQALAGLGDLRLYLIRELHRRELEGPEIYSTVPDAHSIPRGDTAVKVVELQQAPVTKALKEMLDSLNERPIYKKTISARSFILALENAFRTRISRNQQDAQEFLQIVAERLCDEYHAGLKARQRAARRSLGVGAVDSMLDVKSASEPGAGASDSEAENASSPPGVRVETLDTEFAFPFEGMMESQIECQFCHFKYKPNPTSFVNLTLQVPQKSSATLSSCFDGLMKAETIDDFRCDACSLRHALQLKKAVRENTTSENEIKRLENEISLIEDALENDPETIPKGVSMPNPDGAPKRKIKKHMRITKFPKIMTIHLSRSIFDQNSSTKNAARVSFPERLPLGSIVDRKWYKLLGIVCHKGSHHSGHYESFRRNHLYPPFSTPDAFSSYAQSLSPSRNPSTAPSPRLAPRQQKSSDTEASTPNISTPLDSSSSPSVSSTSLPATSPSRPSTSADGPVAAPQLAPTQPQVSRSASVASLSAAPRVVLSPSSDATTTSPSPSTSVSATTTPSTGGRQPSSIKSAKIIPSSSGASSRFRRKKHPNDRWWRISDDKIKECKTGDVLGMQKEVYLLFYEMERGGGGEE